ncbi:diacylglycerol lipase-beta-like isoform X1 [Acropora muricata]|uniref:diacylglycerol lipase-beta-like isoform X1 n=1 Tax=Acropora muricata TaxID=159855 RepID=UPI0034E5F494
MPGLVAFDRRWHIGSDDLFFPAAIGLVIRFCWLFVISIIYGLENDEIKNCEAWRQLQVFFIGVIVISSLVIINEGAILYVSMQGTLINSRPRRHMPKLLYVQLALYIPELIWAILGTYWTAAHVSFMCQVSLIVAVAVSVALQWSMMVIILIGTLILFDSMGKTHADHCQESSKEMWEKRCNWLCCCFAGRDHQYLSAVSDISEVLSAWFHDADVVASDIAVGLILLQQQQEQMQAEERSQPGESISAKGTPVNFNEPKEKGIVEDAYYFIKFALGSYGWPLYVYMNPCSGPWNLCGQISCCACCNPPPQHIHKDNCCQSNSTGLKLQTQLGDDDLIYCSYQDKIYEVPFYVAVDHLKRAVVVSIRGSMSLQDAMTDLTAQQQEFDIEGTPGACYAHKGILQCALYVKSVLEKRELLQSAFSRAGEGYGLVIVGHSLGAGTASLLSVLLKPAYPDLKCFAYSNPSVLSQHATPFCEDFIVSVVLGKDVVPRMGVNSTLELRDDLAAVIRSCSLPKYRVLMKGCWKALCFCLGPTPRRHSGQGDLWSFFSGSRQYRAAFNGISWENNLTQPLLSYKEGEATGLTESDSSLRYVAEGKLDTIVTSSTPVSVEKLYPAGRILQLEERISFRVEKPHVDAMWADKENYTKIVIHPDMLSDHMPDRVMKALATVAIGVQGDCSLQDV